MLKSTLGVNDFFSYDNPIIYSWDNERLGLDRGMARLDRFYVFANQQGLPDCHVKDYNIDGSCGISDHRPVCCELVLKDVEPAGARYKMNSLFLNEPSMVVDLKNF